MAKNESLLAIQEAILKADMDEVRASISNALDDGVEPAEILAVGVTGAMQTVGEKWNAKEFWLPDVMASAEAVKQGIDFLKTKMPIEDDQKLGTVVIGTVKGDIHSVGKNLVATFLGATGFNVIDLGEDIEPEIFIQAVKEHDADIVAMSCFATNVTPVMTQIIDMLKEEGLRDKVYTMIGGISMTEDWVPKVGADAYSKDAFGATELARAYMLSRQ
jgi:corrinoid protein of di/trimethylamine methyltransferase